MISRRWPQRARLVAATKFKDEAEALKLANDTLLGTLSGDPDYISGAQFPAWSD